jgi:hypothetical protein
MSVPPSETWGWADDDTTCDELLAYVADILTLGEFAGLGREVLHDFAVQVVSAQPQGTDEPEVDSRDTLNYAKIAGYLPMPSRLDKLVR